MLRMAGAAVCLTALALSLGTAPSHAQMQQPSIAYKMAVIDCKCVPSGARVAAYRRLLTKLVTRKCKETKVKLADEITTAQHILARDGYGHYKLLRLMGMLDRSIPNRTRFKQRCASVLAALIVLIEKG